jgi:cardiolipin synthase
VNSQLLLEQAIGIPFTHGNSVEVLKNGDQIFPAMLDAIKASSQRVEFLTFVYWQGDIADQFAEVLSQKAKEGVEVRVLLDGFGALPMKRELVDMMEAAGVDLVWFRPMVRWKIWKADNRTHRKILICDDHIAFTGGVGIAKEWEGDARNENEWRETHFKIQGPAVPGIKSAFIENWIEANDRLNLDQFSEQVNHKKEGTTAIQTVRTSSSVRWSDIVLLYQSLLRLAQKKIYLCTAYFNPDQALIDLLSSKAQEGVDVKVLIPGDHTDKYISKIAAEDTFEQLLNAGIEVRYYTKTMMHAKVLLIDDELSCVGSANFNRRSMIKDDEINLVLEDEDVNQTLTNHFMEDLEYSELVTLQRWKKRGIFRRAFESVTRVFKQEI